MSKENEALIKYFKSHHRKAIERMRGSGSPGAFGRAEGESIAYEHIIDILSDNELRKRELEKMRSEHHEKV